MTASVRLEALSLLKIELMWNFTVCSEISRWRAIALLPTPSASIPNTSISRVVNGGKVLLEQDFALRIKPSSSLGSEITRKTTSFIFIRVFSEYYHQINWKEGFTASLEEWIGGRMGRPTNEKCWACSLLSVTEARKLHEGVTLRVSRRARWRWLLAGWHLPQSAIVLPQR